jgi:phosphohistidine phosphatase
MMQIHLLRHAEAEVVSPSGRDADRRLTDDGEKRMKAVARAIARLQPEYDLVLCSPYVRARQTAEPVVHACRAPEPVITEYLLPGAPPEEILHELARRRPQSVLLVGHQPHLGLLFGRLLLGRDGLELPMKKASLAVFDAGNDPSLDPATLKTYLPPRVVETLS